MSRIILLNGASSAGKSSIARALRDSLDTPFMHLSSDQLVEVGALSRVDRSGADSAFAWRRLRPVFFDGFHRSVKGFADAGMDLIVDHIVESPAWLEDCVDLWSDHRVLFVGVYCQLGILEGRERARGDRAVGEARSHLLEDRIHSFARYDFEVDTTRRDAFAAAGMVRAALNEFRDDGVFARLTVARRLRGKSSG